MSRRVVGRQTDRRGVHGGHVTCSVGHVELEEEGPTTLRVVWVEGFDWVSCTSDDVVLMTVTDGGLGC